MSWQEISANTEMEVGKKYRLVGVFKSPLSKEMETAITRAIQLGVGVRNELVDKLKGMVRIDYIIFRHPEDLALGRVQQWELIVEFHKTGPGSPVLVIGGLLVLIIAGVIGFTMVTKRFEQDVAEPTIALTQGFAPILILAVVALVILRR